MLQRFASFEPMDGRWKFRILEAECCSWRGKSPEQRVLSSCSTPSTPSSSSDRASTVRCSRYYRRGHSPFALNFIGAEQALVERSKCALPRCRTTCGAVARSQGILAVERGRLECGSRNTFSRALSFARLHSDRFLEATALSNLGHSPPLHKNTSTRRKTDPMQRTRPP